MKRNLYLSLTALVLALTVNVAFAQSGSKANVPFAFTADGNSMAAGHYTISVSDRVTRIHNDTTNQTVTLIAGREESAKPQNTRMVFHKYGNSYFLAELWNVASPAGASGVALATGAPDQEVRASYMDASARQEVIIAMR